MARPILPEAHLHPAVRERVDQHFRETLDAVRDAVARHDVVVLGMAQNPFVRRVRKALAAAGVSFEYLEYGSYLSAWRRRTAIKMWSGWPTFPMVFVRGALVGGHNDTVKLIESGELPKLIAAPRAE